MKWAKKVRMLLKEIREYDKQNASQVVISSGIKSYYQKFIEGIDINFNVSVQRKVNRRGSSFFSK